MDKTRENAVVVCQEVLRLKPGETFLIVTNLGHDVFEISLKLAEEAARLGAKPPALNHDDSIILNPTIRVFLPDGEITILEEGEITI